MEIVELQDHPWFCASQFHPEFKSRPNRPQPLFRDFVGAAVALGGRPPRRGVGGHENLTAWQLIGGGWTSGPSSIASCTSSPTSAG